MRNIIITAGHSDGKGASKDRGASSGKYIEGDLTIEFRDLIIQELSNLGIPTKTDSNSNALKETLNWLKGKFGTRDVLIDIHWNAGPELANGTEIIVPNSSSSFERSIAFELLKIFVNLGFKNRGVKSEAQTARKSLGWMRPVAENILIEVCFLSNKTDMALYEKNKVFLARRIASVLKDFIKN